MEKRFFKCLILLLSVLLCVAMTSCLSILSTIEMVYNNALDTRDISDREYAYGDANPLSVTFENGKMYAVWDVEAGREYKLTVRSGTDTVTVTEESPLFHEGKTDLTALGYDFSQTLTVYLDIIKANYSYKEENRVKYEYTGLTPALYDTYTKPVSAGFTEIDYYIANRAEWFRFWSYLVTFRENYKYDNGVYELNSKVYMAYDYLSLYRTSNYDYAFAYEVYSAIDAYEDSAAYSYTYEMAANGKEGEVYLKFLYDPNPKFTSATAASYMNATDKNDKAHYTIAPEEGKREFKIDKEKKTISVSTSEQLYFAMKMGYRPDPVQESNADHLYTRMKSILAKIVNDNMSDAEKIHTIYDYIVDTVLYDYDFTKNVYKDDDVSANQLFSYRCLYMEGVFGLEANGVFNDDARIAICDGISKAILCLARIEGIECIKISGKVNEEGHAWNKVKINSVWYMVDATWGNSLDEKTGKEFLSHSYILVPDDDKHEETPYITYPAAKNRYNFGSAVDNDPTDENITNRWFPIFPGRPRFSA